MRAQRGVLVKCDSAVKQLLLQFDEKFKFIIMDLDDYHLVVKSDEVWRIKQELDNELEKNQYSFE